jgi:hypothetical protein
MAKTGYVMSEKEFTVFTKKLDAVNKAGDVLLKRITKHVEKQNKAVEKLKARFPTSDGASSVNANRRKRVRTRRSEKRVPSSE